MIYSLATQECITVTSTQYLFMERLAIHQGDMNLAFGDVPVSMAAKQAWAKDPLFWPAVMAHQQQLATANALTLEFLKSHLVNGVRGKGISKTANQAINLSMRLLGYGQENKNRHARIELTPESVTVEFEEGNPGIPMESQPPMIATVVPQVVGEPSFSETMANPMPVDNSVSGV